jgi:hypothetical protein
MRVFVGFEVLTPVVMNISIFWDIAPCDPYENRFGGTYRLHLQARKSAQQETSMLGSGYANTSMLVSCRADFRP